MTGRGWSGVVLVVGAGLALAAVTPGESTRAQSAEEGGEEIVIVVHGLRVNTGLVRGGIYASADVWTQPGHMAAVCNVRPRGGTARCSMRPPGPGRYAFAFYHDANDNRVFDRDLVGFPSEGYGFSNDVRPGFAVPPFESASFAVGAGARYAARAATQYGWNP
jgi:uncharacterized protein (DUF2141 family)